MGESAGAVNVYAVMTSPLLVDAGPPMVHKLLPMSGGISPASERPAGSVATLAPPAAFRGQADLLLRELLIGGPDSMRRPNSSRACSSWRAATAC